MSNTTLKKALAHAEERLAWYKGQEKKVYDYVDCMDLKRTINKWQTEVDRVKTEISETVRKKLPDHIREITGTKL